MNVHSNKVIAKSVTIFHCKYIDKNADRLKIACTYSTNIFIYIFQIDSFASNRAS